MADVFEAGPFDPGGAAQLFLGRRPADVALEAPDGSAARLHELGRDGILVLAYTQVGSPVSRGYAAELGRLHGEYAPLGVRFVGV